MDKKLAYYYGYTFSDELAGECEHPFNTTMDKRMDSLLNSGSTERKIRTNHALIQNWVKGRDAAIVPVSLSSYQSRRTETCVLGTEYVDGELQIWIQYRPSKAAKFKKVLKEVCGEKYEDSNYGVCMIRRSNGLFGVKRKGDSYETSKQLHYIMEDGSLYWLEYQLEPEEMRYLISVCQKHLTGVLV